MIPSLFLEPGFLEGWVRHQRFNPKPHTYTMKKAWVCIDADKLNQFGTGMPGWDYNKSGLHTLKREDFIGSPNISIRICVESVCREYGLTQELGQILCITACKDLGIGMNPAQFYLVHDLEANLIAIICELTNSKDEHYPYVFVVEDQYNLTFQCDKALYVSPYTQMDAVYFWSFYIGKRHFMVKLEVEKPDDPNEERVNSLLFPEKARKDAQRKKIMEVTLSSTLRPFNEKVSKELSYKYLFSGVTTWFQKMWNKLILNENGRQRYKHPEHTKEPHPRRIKPPVSVRRSKRFR